MYLRQCNCVQAPCCSYLESNKFHMCQTKTTLSGVALDSKHYLVILTCEPINPSLARPSTHLYDSHQWLTTFGIPLHRLRILCLSLNSPHCTTLGWSSCSPHANQPSCHGFHSPVTAITPCHNLASVACKTTPVISLYVHRTISVFAQGQS